MLCFSALKIPFIYKYKLILILLNNYLSFIIFSIIKIDYIFLVNNN